MDRNTIIAVVLSVVVIVGSMLLQSVLFPQPDAAEFATPAASSSGPQPLPSAQTPPPVQDPAPGPSVTAVEAEGAAQLAAIQRETGVFLITFSTGGGTITSLRLKEHLDIDGRPVDLVLDPDGSNEFLGMSFGAALSATISTPFHFRDLGPGRFEFSQTFQPDAGAPFVLRKTYSFANNSYLFELRVSVESTTNEAPVLESDGFAYTLTLGPQIGPAYARLDGRNELRQFMSYYDDRSHNQRIPREGFVTEDRRVKWSAIAGKYFAVIAVPDSTQYSITFDQRSHPTIDQRNALYFSRPPIRAARTVDIFRVYAGPKRRQTLASYDDPANDPFGIGDYDFAQTVRTNVLIGWLAAILRFLLDTSFSLIPNYGVAIILVTILIKALLFPITHKSFESTGKMSELAPRVEELRAKYKGKPERMNQEIAALYKKEGVNPVGGCLPLLLQLPVFFAFYNVLYNHFDLRGAEFIAPWIADLTSPERFVALPFSIPLLGWDQLRLLPFIMLGTTFLQSTISQTATANPQMKLMAYAMPVVFFFILYDMPSGLVLYWTVQNLLSIVQQLYINYRKKQKQAPAT